MANILKYAGKKKKIRNLLVQFHKISQAMEEQGDYAMNPYSRLKNKS